MNFEMVEKLVNGVEKYDFIEENDFDKAQEIFDISYVLENFDAECTYNDRPENNFEGIYKFKAERTKDYKRFITLVEQDIKDCEIQKSHDNEYTNKRNEFAEFWKRGLLTRKEALERMESVNHEKCECKKCTFTIPTMKEWKDGRLANGQKLGKVLGKTFGKDLLDFYSLQIKTEREYYLAISSRVQDIAGMSNYAKPHSWDGWNGTSCQDSRHDSEYCIGLAGSLHDDKLFIGMLLEDIEDIDDMEDKLLARVLMRYIVVDDKPCLVPSRYYGNNETKDILDNGLKQLECIDIYSREVRKDTDTKHVERGEITLYHRSIVDINVCVEYDDEVYIECPVCEGSGEYTGTGNNEREYTVGCPCCEGSGNTYTWFTFSYDEWIEEEDEVEVQTYADDYSVSYNRIGINISYNYIRNLRYDAHVDRRDREREEQM